MSEHDFDSGDAEYLKTHVNRIERMVRFQLAASPHNDSHVGRQFKEKRRSADVYLALADGPKTQEELAERTGMSHANVCKICTHLYERDFVRKVRDPTNRKQFRFSWTELERILGISRIAKRYANKAE